MIRQYSTSNLTCPMVRVKFVMCCPYLYTTTDKNRTGIVSSRITKDKYLHGVIPYNVYKVVEKAGIKGSNPPVSVDASKSFWRGVTPLATVQIEFVNERNLPVSVNRNDRYKNLKILI